jgi:hypothetical protein
MENKELTILMKVTSRARPTHLIRCIKDYLYLADNKKDMVWLFSFDYDDDHYNNTGFLDSIAHIIDGDVHFSFGNSKSKIDAINRDVNEFDTKWDILLCISDDQLPVVQGYDSIIRKSMTNDLDSSLWFWDGAQKRINTQEIVGFNYYKRDGFIYDPRFKSFYCDNYAFMTAKKRGKLIDLTTNCIIRHEHPACNHPTSLPQDSLYDRNQKYWTEDEQLFNELLRNGI